jgi:hypothetical protein
MNETALRGANVEFYLSKSNVYANKKFSPNRLKLKKKIVFLFFFTTKK